MFVPHFSSCKPSSAANCIRARFCCLLLCRRCRHSSCEIAWCSAASAAAALQHRSWAAPSAALRCRCLTCSRGSSCPIRCRFWPNLAGKQHQSIALLQPACCLPPHVHESWWPTASAPAPYLQASPHVALDRTHISAEQSRNPGVTEAQVQLLCVSLPCCCCVGAVGVQCTRRAFVSAQTSQDLPGLLLAHAPVAA